MDRPVLVAEPRTLTGKKVKKLRNEGFVPAVLYGRKVAPVNLKLNERDFEKIFREVGTNTVCELKLDDEKRNVLIHEPDTHPVTGAVEHVDIYQVDMTQKITAEVPLNFENEAPAVRGMDGTLVTNKDALEVECLPADLPHEFKVDLSSLVDFEASIKVSDIKVPTGVELLVEPEEVIAFVEAPRSEEEMAELEEVPTEGALPEVIGEEKPAEGEEGAETPAEDAVPVEAEEKKS